MRHETRWTLFAVLAWTAVLAAILARLLTAAPTRNSVYPIFADAGRAWRAGDGLYLLPESTPGKTVFRYSPTVAAAFAPFSLLADRAGNIVWRAVNVAALLGALGWWLRTLRLPAQQWQAVFLLVLPLAVGNINNGQSNLLLLALLLLAVAAAQADRLALAAACCVAATLFKVYPLALGMLLALILPRRFVAWLLLFLVVGLLLPFAFQQPAYVAGQYSDWLRYLHEDDRSGWALDAGYRDLRLLLAAWIVAPDAHTYLAVQLLGAAVCAAAVLALHRCGWERSRVLPVLLALAASWMTLLGPCSESSTYLLLAPSLACGLVTATGGARLCLLASYGMLLAAGAAAWFPGGTAAVHPLGLHPLAGLALLAGVLEMTGRKSRGEDRLVLPS